MENIYKYKRNFYYELENAIQKSNVSFLLGPRKCGKTVGLKQYSFEHQNSIYIDFKTLHENEESMSVFDKVIESIRNNEDVVYLLDEITYAFQPESEISKIAEIFSEIKNSNTKIIFSGSQSIALEAWANRAFCGNASFIRINFLSYAEWLQYKNNKEITVASYNDFLYEVKEFYGLTTLRDYLNGCLEETVISNYKTKNIVFNNDVSGLNTDVLLDVLYSTLLTKSNKTTPQVFANKNQLKDDVQYFFRDIFNNIGRDEIVNRTTSIISERYNSFKHIDANTLKKALLFLHRCDLISLTYVTDDVDKIIDVNTDLLSSENKINYKSDLFEKIIICIKYPMFYVEILKEILQDQMPKDLPQNLLGEIVECHVRGILPERNSFEYHDLSEREVDYVNVSKQLAIEVSVANKRSKNTHFDCLPTDYTKVLLTKDTLSYNEGIYRIPYYMFIYDGLDGMNFLIDQINQSVSQTNVSNDQSKVSDSDEKQSDVGFVREEDAENYDDYS